MASVQADPPTETRPCFQSLSSELQQKIFEYVGVSGALSCIDVCRSWRNLFSDSLFLNNVCRQRFGLPFSALPEPSPSEELLIDTQRLAFYGGERIVDTSDKADKAWSKIYAMEIRATWWPCRVGNERVKMEYPWPYDIGLRRPVEWGDKHFAARIHVAFPRLFSAFINGGVDAEFDYRRRYFSRGRPLTTAGSILWCIDERCPQFDLGIVDGRATWALEAISVSAKMALSIVAYSNDTWKTVLCHVHEDYLACYTPPPTAEGPFDVNENLDDVRQSAGPLVDLFIARAGVPSQEIPFNRERRYEAVIYRPVAEFADKNPFKPAQEGLLKLLDQRICEAMNNMFIEKFGVNGEVAENLLQKCVEFLNTKAPCMTIHDHGCDREYTINGTDLSRWKLGKNRFLIAVKRALRRSVNEAYLNEVRAWYLKAFRMAHSWSFKKTSAGGRCCPPLKTRSCRTKKALSNVCTHEAEPDMWPLPVLRAAVDRVPEIQERLQLEVEAFARLCE